MREKKHAIIQTVIDLLGDSSPEKKLSIANVASTLGMAKSTLYEYFDSKETMLFHAVKHLIEQSVKHVSAIDLNEVTSFKTRIISHMETIYHYSQDQKMMQNVLRHPEILSLSPATHEALIEISQQALLTLQQRLRDIIEDGVKEGVLKHVPSETRLKSVEALILGCIIMITDPYFSDDVTSVIHDAYQSLTILINVHE